MTRFAELDADDEVGYPARIEPTRDGERSGRYDRPPVAVVSRFSSVDPVVFHSRSTAASAV